MTAFRLDGRRALVTGAGRGIGCAIAEALAVAGAEVVLVARSADQVDRAAAALRDRGFPAHARAVDVTDLSAFAAMVRDAPPFDIFVNNAGTNRPKPLAQVTEEDYDAVMDLNLKAAIFAAQAVAARMARGSIINVSSQMGHVGAANRTLYCASKWAIEGFTKALAIELAPRGIRVNTICPTFVETPLTRPYLDDPAFREDVLRKIKLGRLATVEEVANGVVFLASDAASFMTGSALMLDGGWTAE
ncbi:SDR family NAD(P)-dependent oxidoreductase [Falsirhodobacter halotolerans]|uniref:SDR family NAD(P)-dependent oxidoreductase n=1 Tax=Falsirhodobacter halotolerans TaxID=1146892 RepID=UPI001FD539E6|nr:SDR family NAD(P)-dependent oxidoreductase [Falsirhodobacter halotolerans]MCJ8140965.1 SDR family oxidoreductase [Falsirhodobacter halotolerans]